MLSLPCRSAAAAAVFLTLGAASYSAEISEADDTVQSLKPPERVAEPQLHPASDEPLKAMAKFKLLPGFKSEVWAAEPMLGNPVAFCLDDKGAVFTAETYRYRTSALDIRHYMFMLEDDLASRSTEDRVAFIKKNFPKDWQKLGIETEVVRRLEDSDGDGKADKTSVYAAEMKSLLDGINSGVLAHDGKVWCTNMPNLWLFSGLTADGRAEKREVLSSGYGVRFSFTGHDMHGLIMGPDGRLYFSFGDRGAHVVTKEGKTIALPDEGAVFRCEPDGSHLELVHRGLRNPQELAFDDHGNLFTGDNDSDQGDRERWVYIAEGGDSGWRVGWQHNPQGKETNPWLAEAMWEPRSEKKQQPAYILSPILNLPDGPSGLVHYPGTGLPAEFADSFLLCGFKGSSARSAITWLKVKESGASFTIVQEPTTFIGDVQATDVDFGPDSRVYFSEWGEGWEGTGRGRIFRMEHTAAQQEQATQIAEVKKLLGEGFAQRPTDELAKLLAHNDQRVRLRAQWALAQSAITKTERSEREEIGKFLIKIASEGVEGPQRQLSRLHAVWGIGQIARLAVRSRHPTGDFEIPPPKPGMPVLLDDSDAEVRAQALSVISQIPGRLSPELAATVVAKLSDPVPRVRFFAAMALAAHRDASGIPAVTALLRENADADQYLRHAGVMALTKADPAALATAANDDSASVRLAVLLALRQRVATQLAVSDVKAQVAEFAASPDAPETKLLAQFLGDKDPRVVAEAARAINDMPIPAAYGALAKLIDHPSKDTQLMLRVINANFRAGTPETAAALAKYAANETAPELLRLEALHLLGTWPKPHARDRVVGVYRPLLGATGPGRVAESSPQSNLQLVAAKTEGEKQAPIQQGKVTPDRPAAPAAAALKPALPQLLASKQERVLLAAIDAIYKLRITDEAAALHALVANADASPKARAAALQTLASFEDPKLSEAIKIALAGKDSALRVAATAHLGKLKPDEAATQLATIFPTAAAAEKRQILTALGGLKGAEADRVLLAMLAEARAGKIPADAQLELIEAAGKRNSSEVKASLDAWVQLQSENDKLGRYSFALAGGDVAAGEKLFKEHAVAQCFRCHKVKGVGGEAGPDLTGIAKQKDRRYLLESIVDPNATIAHGFDSFMCTLSNGDIKAGILKSETADAITLVLPVPGATPEVVKKADIKQREKMPSGMPPGLGEFLSKRELRDILEYVASLK